MIKLPEGTVSVSRDLNSIYGLASSLPFCRPGGTSATEADEESSRNEVNFSLLMTLGPKACANGWAGIFDRIGLSTDSSVLAHTLRMEFGSPVLVDETYRVTGCIQPSRVTLGKRASSHFAFEACFEFWPIGAIEPLRPSATVTMTMVSSSEPTLA